MQTQIVPTFYAWINVMPGTPAHHKLHVTGTVLAPTPCDIPKLAPLKGAPLLFEIQFTRPKDKLCPQIVVPKNIEPYEQDVDGTPATLSIKIPGEVHPLIVPIHLVS